MMNLRAVISLTLTAYVVLAFAVPTPSLGGSSVGRPRILVPRDIDATGSADVSRELQAFVDRVPDGSTVVFRRKAKYRIDDGLRLDARHDLDFKGNGTTLKSRGCQHTDSSFVIGWDTPSDNIRIRGLKLVGNNWKAGGPKSHRSVASRRWE